MFISKKKSGKRTQTFLSNLQTAKSSLDSGPEERADEYLLRGPDQLALR